MADAATQQLVGQLVQEHVQAGAMFTAYDLTLEARRRGGSVRHQDVRDLVHEFFENGRMGAAYNRTLIDVGAPTRPLLYHRFSDDPSTYQPPQAPAVPQPPANPILQFIKGLFGRDPDAGAVVTPPPSRRSPSR